MSRVSMPLAPLAKFIFFITLSIYEEFISSSLKELGSSEL